MIFIICFINIFKVNLKLLSYLKLAKLTTHGGYKIKKIKKLTPCALVKFTPNKANTPITLSFAKTPQISDITHFQSSPIG